MNECSSGQQGLAHTAGEAWIETETALKLAAHKAWRLSQASALTRHYLTKRLCKYHWPPDAHFCLQRRSHRIGRSPPHFCRQVWKDKPSSRLVNTTPSGASLLRRVVPGSTGGQPQSSLTRSPCKLSLTEVRTQTDTLGGKRCKAQAAWEDIFGQRNTRTGGVATGLENRLCKKLTIKKENLLHANKTEQNLCI